MNLRNARWYWIAICSAVAVWLGFAFVVAPMVVASAYHGRSLSVLNRLIEGQETHSIEYYLDLWSVVRFKATIVIVAGATVLSILVSNRRVLGGFAQRLTARSVTIATGTIVGLSVLIGGVAGFCELLIVVFRRGLSDYPGHWYPSNTAWMTPVAATSAFLLVGLALALCAKVLPKVFGIQTVFVMLICLAVYSVIRSAIPGIYWYATLLVSLGLSIRLLGLVMVRRERILSLQSRATRATILVLAVFTLGQPILLWGTERIGLSRLPEPDAGTPNVLLLILDTVRAQSLSLYGYGRRTTPSLERLADESVVFDRAMAPAPWTLPSHATLFSGEIHRDIRWARPVSWKGLTLAEVLGDHGYATGGFVANLSFGTRYFGLDRGFVRYEDYPASLEMVVMGSWLTRGFYQRMFSDPRREPARKSAECINTSFLTWQERIGDRPFFAFLNYMDAHDPYSPPEPWNLRFRAAPGRVRLGGRWMTYTPDDVQQLRGAYDGSIAYIDDQIGNLIEELDRREALENTLLIVTADHGEEFLEHGVMGHSQSLYSSALHVPLIIRFPGHVPQGRRIGHTVGLRQVAATVADLLGLRGTPFTGRSLVEEWVSASLGDSLSSEPLFAEAIAKTYALPDHYPISRGTIRSIVWNDLHHIRGPGEVEELYDLRNDPFEQDDLWKKTETLGLVDLIRAAYDQAERRTRSRR